MGKAKKNLGLGLICVAVFFLFNPWLAVFDVLPDVIGYLLLCAGLTQVADINYHMEDALRYFKKMILVSCVHLFSLFIFFGFVTAKERPVATLLLTFIFALIEVILLTHAYRQMFEGFLYMGSRMDATAIFNKESYIQKKEKQRQNILADWERKNEERQRKELPPLPPPKFRPIKTATAKISALTMAFVIVKAILTVLPEFSALTEQATHVSTRFVFLYDFIGLYRTFTIFLLLPVCVIWLVSMLRYITSITADRPFMQAITEKYKNEVEPKTHLFIQRAVKLAFAILSIGALFSINFYIEDNSILPDFICSLLVLAALVMLRRFVKIPLYSYLSCVLHAAASGVNYILAMRFYENYSLSSTGIRLEAHHAFFGVQIVHILSALLFFLMILSLVPIFKQIITLYTGFTPPESANTKISDKIEYVHRMLCKKLVGFLIIAAICTVSGIAYILLVKTVNFIWIIDLVIHSVFAIYTFTMLNSISEEISQKYLLS